MRITHVIPSLGLALTHAKIDNGKIVSGEVVNGAWYLKRSGGEWLCKSDYGRVINQMPVKPEDDVFVEIPVEMQGLNYNTVIFWAEDQIKRKCPLAPALPGDTAIAGLDGSRESAREASIDSGGGAMRASDLRIPVVQGGENVNQEMAPAIPEISKPQDASRKSGKKDGIMTKDENKLLDIEFYVGAAQQHGEDSEPDHEVGDLQDFLRAMWELLPPQQRKAFALNEFVHNTLEGALADYEDALEELRGQIAYSENTTEPLNTLRGRRATGSSSTRRP